MKFETKPKPPSLETLSETIDQLEHDINEGGEDVIITSHEALFVRNSLVWLANMLGGRKTYQKTNQVRRKLERDLLKKYLAKDELERIQQLAREQANTILNTNE